MKNLLLQNTSLGASDVFTEKSQFFLYLDSFMPGGNKRSYTLKQTSSFCLQVCLRMFKFTFFSIVSCFRSIPREVFSSQRFSAAEMQQVYRKTPVQIVISKHLLWRTRFFRRTRLRAASGVFIRKLFIFCILSDLASLN